MRLIDADALLNNTDGDTISRQAAIDAIMSQPPEPHYPSWYAEQIKTVPSARRKGKWIYPTDIKGYGRCPHCKALWDYSLISNPFFKFCPRCGNGEAE